MDIASLSIKVLQSGVQEANAGLSNLKTNAAGAAQGVDKVDNSSKKLNTTTTTLAGSMGGLLGAVRSIGVAYGGLQLIKAADDMLNYEGRIRNATDSLEEADYVLANLYSTAAQTGSLESAISIFQRLSFTRKEIKATSDEMLQFVDTVQKLGVVSGASPDALKFGLTQMGQSLSSNIVRAEEFNSIMENIPAVGKQIADQFGISTGQLRGLVIEGKVLSEDVFAAILNAQDEVQAKFDAMPMTAGRAFSALGIRIMEMVGQFNEASNATGLIVGGLEMVGDVLEGLVGLVNGFIYTFKAMFNGIIGGIMTMITGVIEGIQAIVNAGLAAGNVFRSKENQSQMLDWVDSGATAAMWDATKDDVGKNLTGAGEGFKGFVDGGLNAAGIGDKDYEVANKTEGATRKIATNYADMAKNLKDGNKEAEKHQKQVAKTLADLEFRNEQMGRSITDQEIYNNLRQANVDIDSVAGQKIKNLSEEYLRLKEEEESLKRVTDGLGDAFSDAFKSGMEGAKSFGEIMKSLVDDIQDIFYELAVSAPLKKLIGSIFDQGIGGGGGAGGGLGSLLNFGNGSNPIGSLLGFAGGGEFQVGGNGGTDSQVVAFRASPDETVSIKRPDQQGGNGGGITYNIDARGADAGVEERLMRALISLDKSVDRRAQSAVDYRMRRDPTFGQQG